MSVQNHSFQDFNELTNLRIFFCLVFLSLLINYLSYITKGKLAETVVESHFVIILKCNTFIYNYSANAIRYIYKTE